MKIRQETFLSLLGMSETLFAVPMFQRVYSWEKRHALELWNDVMRAGVNEAGHFAGVLLFAPEYESWGTYGRLSVIDGQQRLTTVTLLLTALRDHLREAEGVSDAVPTAAEIDAMYLHVADVENAPVRLQLSFIDRVTLNCLVGGEPMPEDFSARICEIYEFFLEQMKATRFDEAILWRGLSELQVISALLENDDSPQLIFESLNARGKSLSAADLVRNSLLFSLESEEQMRLYRDYWRPMEADLLERGIGDGMEKLLRAWLASRYRDSYVKNENDVFAVLKKHLSRKNQGSHERLLREIASYETRYAADADFRSKADKEASAWLDGKAAGLISSRRMFGD